MDAAIGFMLSLIFLALFIFGIALLYKNRAVVKRWLDVPYYAVDDRKLRLKRRIEDAQSELESLEKSEKRESPE